MYKVYETTYNVTTRESTKVLAGEYGSMAAANRFIKECTMNFGRGSFFVIYVK